MAVKIAGADDGTPTTLGHYCKTICKFTAIATGSMTEFRVKANGNGQCKLAVYSDVGGTPTTLLASNNNLQSVVNDWNVLTFGPLAITNGVVYWLGVASDNHEPMCFNSSNAGTVIYDTPGTPFISTFSWGNPPTQYTYTKEMLWAAWGTTSQTLSPASLALALSLSTHQVNLKLYPSAQAITLALGAAQANLKLYAGSLNLQLVITAPQITITELPGIGYAKILVTHPAIKEIKVYHAGQLKESLENLSNLQEHRIETAVELPVALPAIVEVTTISNLKYTFTVE